MRDATTKNLLARATFGDANGMGRPAHGHVRRRLSDAFFLDFPQHRSLTTGLSGAAEVRVAGRAMVERRADVIKVMMTQRAGWTDTDFRVRVLSDACLGIDGRTGAVKPGLEADLVVVDRDPIADLRAVENPVLVVNDGHIAVNRIRR